MTDIQINIKNDMEEKEKEKDSKPKIPLRCRILGHEWKGDSLRRVCVRCGKVQVSKFSTDNWVDA